EELQDRALAGAVAADDPERLPALDAERDVLERPEVTLLELPRALAARQAAREPRDQVAQRGVELATPELLEQPLNVENGVGHGCHTLSAKKGSSFLNMSTEAVKSSAVIPRL